MKNMSYLKGDFMDVTVQNQDRTILPILLGTDANAYGMARSFHQAYGIQSLALGKVPLLETRHSRIVSVQTFENFDQSDVFLNVLEDIVDTYTPLYKHLVLIACGDRYTELLTEHKAILSENFYVPYISQALKEQLENKEDFYEICETYGLPYPKTTVISKGGRHHYDIPFDFPVAVKASDSIAYVDLDFPGKKKSYKADDAEELDAIVQAIFDAGYNGRLIVQDFIPGDDATMYVLNSYSDVNSNVRAMCLGHCVLEDYTPAGIGNYNAIIQESIPAIYTQYQQFLEDIGFVGFSNFDLKYDARDGTYKVFEINIRQGRSSFFTTASGCNLVTFLVNDLVHGVPHTETYYHNNPVLWRHVPRGVLRKYAPTRTLDDINDLIAAGKDDVTLLYQPDKTLYRRLMINRFYWQAWEKYRRYFNKRNLNDA